MSDAEWIASAIGMLRIAQRRSLRDVAAYCEVQHTTVIAWEHGRAVPSAVSLIRLARLFDVSLAIFDRLAHDNN